MKELTIEQKAKAYDEALERARELSTSISGAQYDTIFPELKESSDERIRKELIAGISKTRPNTNFLDTSITREDALVWLERQGESDETKAKMFLIDKGYPIDTNGIFPTYEEMYNIIREGLEEQSEQKPADKVQPKFRNGQWIIWQDKCYKVNYNGCGYELVDQNGLSTSLEYGTVDDNAHIWDIIPDAKDGDVLATLDYILVFKEFLKNDGGISYCHYDFGAGNPQFIWFEDKNWYFGKEAIIHPATKEQRNLLFQKMKEAGYEWDTEHKQLKKIEQKPAWSEEDVAMLDSAIAFVEHSAFTTIGRGKGVVVAWLKSLKDRRTWFPSDEQMKALDDAIAVCSERDYETECRLDNLRQDLKKLMKE